jgi:hypothetical protein
MQPDNETPTETYEPTLRDHVETALGVLTLAVVFYIILLVTPN